MTRNLIPFLIIISFLSTHASHLLKKEIVLPQQFPKEYWYQLDLYQRGNIPFIYNAETNKILHQEMQNWQAQNICSLYGHNYNQEHCKIQKNEMCIDTYRKQQQEMNKKSKKAENEQKDIISRVKQRIASNELDITLLKKEIDIQIKESSQDQEVIKKKNQLIQEKENHIKKHQAIIDDCKLIVLRIRRENKESLELIEQHIVKHQKIIDTIKQNVKGKKISLKLNNRALSLGQFYNITKKTSTDEREFSSLVFLQSLLASLVTLEEGAWQSLSKNLTFHQMYIFSLGIFFRWYVDTDHAKKNEIDTLLQKIIGDLLEKKDPFIEPYEKSFMSIIAQGLEYYEIYYMLKLKLSDDLEKLIRKAQAIKNILFLLDPFRQSEFFNFFYNTKKEKLNELMKNIEDNVRTEISKQNVIEDAKTSEENIKNKNENCLKNEGHKNKTVHVIRNIVLCLCFYLTVYFLHFENKTT